MKAIDPPTPRTNLVLLTHFKGEINRDDIAALADHARQLEIELAAEKARLDWLSEHNEISIYRTNLNSKMIWWLPNITPHDVTPKSLRAAIDAAREAK